MKNRPPTPGRPPNNLGKSPGEALEAIRKSLKFLESNGALHTMDEEASLFPRLRPRLTGEQAAHLDRLEEQHLEVELVLSELKGVVAELAATSQPAAPVESRYRELVARLAALYRPHIQFEDEVLMRLASRVLTASDLQDISGEMRVRRTEMDELARQVLNVLSRWAAKRSTCTFSSKQEETTPRLAIGFSTQ
jgi:hemerythrin-like domain-containing protein